MGSKPVAWYGERPTAYQTKVMRVLEDGTEQLLEQRIVYHSPDGFEWGYGGSGPSDLALNILADYFGWEGSWHYGRKNMDVVPDPVWALHNPMKFAFLADAPRQAFYLSRDKLTGWLRENGVEELAVDA